MNDYSERLNELAKKFDKPTKARIEEFASVLSEMYNSEGSYDDLTDWLLRIHYKVGKRFFENNRITDTDALGILHSVENHPLLMKSGQNYLFDRLFTICQAYIIAAVDCGITAKLAYMIAYYGKQKEKFSTSIVNSFKHIFADNAQCSIFVSLPQYVDNAHDKRVINDFINYCEIKLNKEEEAPADKVVQQPSFIVASDKNNTEHSTDNSKMELKELTEKLKEQLDRLIKANDIVEMIKAQLYAKDKEYESLSQELKTTKGKCFSLEMELAEKKKEVEEYSSKINDLETRLKSVFEMDDSIRNQEIQTLRKDVADALRMEYLDYKESDQSFNEDNFVANSASLERVFKILIRFGFELDK